jgi:hypothetical protein
MGARIQWGSSLQKSPAAHVCYGAPHSTQSTGAYNSTKVLFIGTSQAYIPLNFPNWCLVVIRSGDKTDLMMMRKIELDNGLKICYK